MVNEMLRVRDTAQSDPAVGQENDIIDKLERLGALFDKGLLTSGEFEAQKKRILQGN
jgi:hypothetical protein